jgi:hypothetical protein
MARRGDGKPSAEELRAIAAVSLHVRVGELLPHLVDVVSNSSVAEDAVPGALSGLRSADVLSFSQSRNGIAAMCTEGCSMYSIAVVIIERRLAAGEHPENIWGRADRALRGGEWNP